MTPEFLGYDSAHRVYFQPINKAVAMHGHHLGDMEELANEYHCLHRTSISSFNLFTAVAPYFHSHRSFIIFLVHL